MIRFIPTKALETASLAALIAAAALLCAGAAQAQLVAVDPDWKEGDTPTPPTFSKDKLILVETPPYMTVKIGVDPSTLTIGADGVVRYVMVATSPSGPVNAAFEGIRCSTGEIKTYARYLSAGWSVIPGPEWKPLLDEGRARYSLMLARQGVCVGRAPQASVPALVQALRSSRKIEP